MFGFSLGGGKEKSKSSTSGTENLDQTITRLNAEDQNMVRDMIATFTRQQGEGDAFTRERALQDVRGRVEGLFTQYREQAIPEIMSAQNRVGGYASTTGQRLANDAFARTVAEGAKLELEATKTYADIASMIRQVAQQGQGLGLEALLQSEEKTKATSKVKSKTSGKSSGMNAGLGLRI
jgi:hypothetical protein